MKEVNRWSCDLIEPKKSRVTNEVESQGMTKEKKRTEEIEPSWVTTKRRKKIDMNAGTTTVREFKLYNR